MTTDKTSWGRAGPSSVPAQLAMPDAPIVFSSIVFIVKIVNKFTLVILETRI